MRHFQTSASIQAPGGATVPEIHKKISKCLVPAKQ